jgi:hypothetical protein
MINEVDEVLRQLLVRELPIKNNEIDIAFNQPKREWSARLSRPTLNLFLYNLYENKQLRQTQPIWDIQPQDNGTVTKRRKPLRVDLKYLITAWATEPEDEHRLLSQCLFAFARYPNLPADLLPEALQNQPVPIAVSVGQQEEFASSGDFWGAIDNEWRPGISCVLTMAIDPYRQMIEPVVRSGEIKIGESAAPQLRKLVDGAEADRYWSVGGTVRTDRPVEDIQLRLVERGLDVALQPDGKFALTHLRAGHYTLEILVKGHKPRRHKVTIPAADYDLEV